MRMRLPLKKATIVFSPPKPAYEAILKLAAWISARRWGKLVTFNTGETLLIIVTPANLL